MMNNSGSIFSKLISEEPKKERPSEPEKILRGPLKPVVPPTNRFSSPTEQVLDFLINHWPAPTISVRNIQRHGPNSVRGKQKYAMRIAEILAENGWLERIKSRRRDRYEWRIARGPS
jgi:hypothetical protein